MLISGDNRSSKLTSCLAAASNFLLSNGDAKTIFEAQKEIVNDKWDTICEEARLNAVDKNLLWGRQFLNSFASEEH